MRRTTSVPYAQILVLRNCSKHICLGRVPANALHTERVVLQFQLLTLRQLPYQLLEIGLSARHTSRLVQALEPQITSCVCISSQTRPQAQHSIRATRSHPFQAVFQEVCQLSPLYELSCRDSSTLIDPHDTDHVKPKLSRTWSV